MNELIITQENLNKMRERCEISLLNDIFNEVKVIVTQQSNFWDVTTCFHTKTNVKLIDKVQVVSYFIMLGGRVELDSHMHDFSDWQKLWNYLFEHSFISQEEYDFLCGFWISKEKISRMM